MFAAVSTACLYPMPTEDALYDLCLHGVGAVEVFLNAPSETRAVFVSDLKAILSRYNVRCTAVHPWTAPNEGFMLFSGYPRRCRDFLEESKRVFETAAALGARYYILHGPPLGGCREVSVYCERFHMLAEVGRTFGITVTQENVNRYESMNLTFLRAFLKQLGDEAKLTFDTKQAVRAGMDFDEAARLLGSAIVNVHLSDHGPRGDCLRIGKGTFDIVKFLAAIHARGFDGAVVLELYRDGFEGTSQLSEDYHRMERLIERAKTFKEG